MREIENDKLGETEFIQFLTDVFNLLHIYSKDTDKYIFNDWKCFHLFREACINSDFKIKNVIVWNKEYQTQALNKFANAHELIIFIGDNDKLDYISENLEGYEVTDESNEILRRFHDLNFTEKELIELSYDNSLRDIEKQFGINYGYVHKILTEARKKVLKKNYNKLFLYKF